MTLILCGGGWAEKTVIPNKLFGSLIDSSKPILYIPLARDPAENGYESSFAWIHGEFSNIAHGDIVMVNSSEEILDKNLDDYAAIFIGGGNTYKLLKRLKDSGVFDRIKKYIDNGGIVYGCSAGAIIFGKNIDSCLYMDPNDVELSDTKGFNSIFDFSFTAHYTNKNEEKTKKATDYLLQYSEKEPVIALPEEDSLYVNGNKIKIIGTRPWYVFNHGNKKHFEPNSEYFKEDFINVVDNV